MRIDELSDMHLDALREVGGVGAGHAATALSQLVDRPISLEVPRIEVLELTEVPKIFGGPERLAVAVYTRMLGDISGGILFMVERAGALALVDLMRGHTVGSTVSLSHDEEALLRHVASILMSAYLAAVARMADVDVLPSDPALAFDMAGALLQGAISEIGMQATRAVLVRTAFVDEGQSVEAALFFMPDPDSLSVILGRLGVA